MNSDIKILIAFMVVFVLLIGGIVLFENARSSGSDTPPVLSTNNNKELIKPTKYQDIGENYPIATITIMLIGAVIWFIFEYGSVVSFLCITTLTVVEGIRAKMTLPELDRKIICLMLFAIFAFTWYAHRKNIERLLLGKESKASIKKKVKKKLSQKAS
jgi:hypothetical protein